MAYSENVELLLKEVRSQLVRVEELLSALQPCDGQKDGVLCALGPHVGWHQSADGKSQWMDD